MNVIWIISDTFRRDHLGAYGNQDILTPSLDALAAKSVRFDRHYMASFPTMPARADFMTGRWTMSFMQWEPLPRDEVILAQLLTSAGIHTAAIVDTPFYMRTGMYYDRGFQTFFDIHGQLHHSLSGTPYRGEAADLRATRHFESDCFAAQTFNKAMQWLDYHYKEDFLLYIDAWDPHEPWDAPDYYTERYWPGYDGEVIPAVYGHWQDVPGYTEEKVKKAHAAYCGEVTMVDTWAGYFLRKVENMGLMENTAIIFTSDHGYYFGEHGGLFGKMVLDRDPKSGKTLGEDWGRSPCYEEVASIPLFIYVPNVSPATHSGLTSAVDLMPTVMDIMGQKVPSTVEGRSLLPIIKEPTLDGREYVVSAEPFANIGDIVRNVDDIGRRSERDSTATVTTDEWSLLYDVAPGLSELYNLSSDPGQEKNVISRHPDMARELHQLLVEFMRETHLPERLMDRRLELYM